MQSVFLMVCVEERVLNGSWAPGECTAAYLKQCWTRRPPPKLFVLLALFYNLPNSLMHYGATYIWCDIDNRQLHKSRGDTSHAKAVTGNAGLLAVCVALLCIWFVLQIHTRFHSADILEQCSLLFPPRWGAGPMALMLWLEWVI
ncbi:hypothetical protein COO60DRAFT_767788 [Scenedesmus sp. NREL 46B-D3]|nr:hypothetical protein COO60DRAFT_767788 [Scenedesmus sp. NREL 46B-D3]